MAAIVAAPIPLEQIGRLAGPQFGSKGVACLETDGVHVYAGCRDHAIRVYDAQTQKLLYALGAPTGPLDEAREGHVGCVTALKLHGGTLFSGSGDSTVRAWDVQERGPLRKVGEHGAIVTALAIVDATLYSADANGFVGLWDLKTFRTLGELEAKPSVYALAVVEGLLYAARGGGESVVAWDVSTRERADAPPYTAESLLAVGRRLYLGRDDGSISVWDASRATPLPAATLEDGHDGCVTALTSIEGSMIVSGGEDGGVVCWDAATRQRRWATRPREGAVNGADVVVADDFGCLFSASPMAPDVQVWRAQVSPTLQPGGARRRKVATAHAGAPQPPSQDGSNNGDRPRSRNRALAAVQDSRRGVT